MFDRNNRKIKLSSDDIANIFLSSKSFIDPITDLEMERDTFLDLKEIVNDSGDKIILTAISNINNYRNFSAIKNDDMKKILIDLRKLGLILNGYEDKKLIAFYKIHDYYSVLIRANILLKEIESKYAKKDLNIIKSLPLYDNELKYETIGDILNLISNINSIDDLKNHELFRTFFFSIVNYLHDNYDMKQIFHKKINLSQ
jgi:hypothetical protein